MSDRGSGAGAAAAPRARLLGRALTLLWCGLVAGVLLAVAALPAAALTGLAAASGAEAFQDLPADLRIPPQPQASRLYADDGRTLITTFADEYRTSVPLARVSPVLRQAVVAAEDRRFYQHGGVDPAAVLRSLVANAARGRVVQGASTLTMQYVRNVLVQDSGDAGQAAAASSDSRDRKLREMRYAVALERSLTKDQILERYLNIVYFGHGAYGIDAASHVYFSVPPDRLTLAQAALLAGLLRAPDADDPTSDPAAALQRRGYVLAAMARGGDIAAGRAAAAAREPLGLAVDVPPSRCAGIPASHPDWGWFCAFFQRWWDAQPVLGATAAERQRRLDRGGYRITSSLNAADQVSARRHAVAAEPVGGPRTAQVALVRPGSGRVLALSANRDYSAGPDPPATTAPPAGVDLATYPAGTTLALATLLAAVGQGLPLDTNLDPGAGTTPDGPAPDTSAPGTMWTGFGRPDPAYLAALARRVGARQVTATAARLGLTGPLPGPVAGSGAAPPLADVPVSPLALAEAYAALAAGGRYCAPLPVRAVLDPAGRSVPAATPSCQQAVGAGTAAAVADAARCAAGDTSAFGRCAGAAVPDLHEVLGRPVAGQAGTSRDGASTLLVAVTPRLAVAGVDAGQQAGPPDAHDATATGSRTRRWAAALAAVLAAALAGQPVAGFPAPGCADAFGADGTTCRPPAPPPPR